MSESTEPSAEAAPGDPQLPARSPTVAGSPLPAVHVEHDSAVARRNVEEFQDGIAAMFEAWVARRDNKNTQKAYRTDVLSFARFVGIPVLHTVGEDGDGLPPTFDPAQAHRLLRCSVGDVQEWRDYMVEVLGRAPKTVLRRITSVSRFYEYIREQAAEFRIATTIPNPAHKNHIPRFEADSVRPTEALTPARIRQLKEMCPGESTIAYRDRAIIRFYLYTGARIRTGCLLRVEDCRLEPEDPTLLLQEKGHKSARRPVGVHFELAEALQEYITCAELTSGPLFRARKASRTEALSDAGMNEATMYRLLLDLLKRLPRSMQEVELPDGTKYKRCKYTPHSLRATTATQLDEAGVPTKDIQKLLGHKQLKTTEGYIKTARSTKQSASHKIPY